MRKKYLHFTFALFLTVFTKTGFAQSLILTSGMPAPGLPDQKLALLIQVAANSRGKVAFIASLERLENRDVLYVQDERGLRPVIASGDRIGERVIDSIFALRMIENGTIYFLSEFKTGGITGIVSIDPQGAARLLFSSEPFNPSSLGRQILDISSYHVNQRGDVVFIGSSYSSATGGGSGVFQLAGSQAEEILTASVVAHTLPNCIGFRHPLITDDGRVFAAAYRLAGPLGMTAPLALVERTLTGVRVWAKEGDAAPSGSTFRSVPGGIGFEPLASTPDDVYFVSDTVENSLELHKLTADGLARVPVTIPAIAPTKVSVVNTLITAGENGLGLVAARIKDSVRARSRLAVLVGPDFHEVLSDGGAVQGRILGQLISVSASRRFVYVTTRFDDKTGGTGLLRIPR